MANLRVGILGATGLVGRELLKVLFDRKFPVTSLRLYASERSVGKLVETPLGNIAVENADKADYSELDIAFLQSAEAGQKRTQIRQQVQGVQSLIIPRLSGMITLCHWSFPK